MQTLVLIYLVFTTTGPIEQRVSVPVPTEQECESMRRQQSFIPPPEVHRLFVGSYCEAK